MTDAAAMLNAYPTGLDGIDEDALILCVQQCLNCAHTATLCADACLAEPEFTGLARCVDAALICADVAETTARTVSRLTGRDNAVIRAVLDACIEACRLCYDECRKHALSREHCRICADACHRCSHACRELLSTLR
jgi:hypothetical protein